MPSSVDPVKDFLERYLRAAGMALEVHAELDPSTTPPTLHVHFTGPDVPLLLDRNADLLNALEHLAAKLLGLTPEQHHQLRFDAAGYKLGRDQELQALAAKAISGVTTSGHPVRLPPMNSRERRMLHLLAAEAGLTSASTGAGPFRSVTLFPHGTPPPSQTDRTAADQPPSAHPSTARTDRLRSTFRRR